MTVNELLNDLKSSALSIMEPTCDKVLVGDGEKQIGKVAVCFNLSAKMLDKIVEWGADTIISHEGVFGSIDRPTGIIREYDLKKKEILEKNGITLFRFHDHAHNREVDYIHAGFIKTLGLELEMEMPRTKFARAVYKLKTPMTVEEIAKLALKNINLKLGRVVGDKNTVVNKVCLALGWVDLFSGNDMHRPDCELIISGEVGSELYCQYYMRDGNYYGNKQCLLLLGHIGGEISGMKYFAEELKEKGFDAKYFEEDELYDNIFNEDLK